MPTCAKAFGFLSVGSDTGVGWRDPRLGPVASRVSGDPDRPRCACEGLAESLQVCERKGIDPPAATPRQLAVFVRELTSRPSRRATDAVALDSGAGSANAALQRRRISVRLFYDFLVEEGVRESNPVGAVMRLVGCPVVLPMRWCRNCEAAVDSQRGRTAATAENGCRRADPQPDDVVVGL
jgi:hypothetical protein